MKIFGVDPGQPELDLISEIASLLRKGAIIAYPTDTFYALGGDGFNPESTHKIRILKGRGGAKPFPYIIDNPQRLAQWGISLGPPAAALADVFWPGPVSLVVSGPTILPANALDSRKTLCVRVPDNRIARALAGSISGLVIATSANPSGCAPARTAHEALEHFRGEIDAIVDGGPSASEAPSTIVDVTGQNAIILREGAVPSDRIKAVIARAERKENF
ncbi:threonylcarbamoyl-AMP synthase [Candidatus Poribacteria bacterium]|nr:threonylcarbamoyl-AMP synthase [Candidatus Poribacteria bacterium]